MKAKHFIKLTPGQDCWWFYKEGSFNEPLGGGVELTGAQAKAVRDFCEMIYQKGQRDARAKMREALGL